MTEELCDNCKKPIPGNEPACVLGEKIICQACDTALRNTPPKPKEPENGLAEFISFICVAAVIVELIALLLFFTWLIDDRLPDGPYEMAVNLRSSAHTKAKLYMLIDAALVTLTLSVLMLARILHAVNRTAHYLSRRAE